MCKRCFLVQKIKRIVAFIIFISIISVNISVFADENYEEELEYSEIDNMIKVTAADVKEIPNINSRCAVVYDRATRKCALWKERKPKIQDGKYNKNHHCNSRNRKSRKFTGKNRNITKVCGNRRFKTWTS